MEKSFEIVDGRQKTDPSHPVSSPGASGPGELTTKARIKHTLQPARPVLNCSTCSKLSPGRIKTLISQRSFYFLLPKEASLFEGNCVQFSQKISFASVQMVEVHVSALPKRLVREFLLSRVNSFFSITCL